MTLVEGAKKQPPLRMDINTDDTPRTEVSKETASNNCEENPKDTSVKEMQSTDLFASASWKDCSTKQQPNMNWIPSSFTMVSYTDMHQITLMTFAP